MDKTLLILIFSIAFITTHPASSHAKGAARHGNLPSSHANRARFERFTRKVGLQADGAGVTPTNWTVALVGKQIPVGEMPLGAIMTTDGSRLIVSNNGQGEQSLMFIDTTKDILPEGQAVIDKLVVPRPRALFYGLAISPDGKTLYASGGPSDEVHVIDLATAYPSGRMSPVEKGALSVKIELPAGAPASMKSPKNYPAGLALSADGSTLYVANVVGNSVWAVNVADGAVKTKFGLMKNPYAVVLVESSQKGYVSNWGSNTVSALDLAAGTVVRTISVGEHPCALCLSPDSKTLFVANANSDSVSVIDVAADQVVHTISLKPYLNAPFGSMPNALAVSADGQTLFVANAGNNDVVAVALADGGHAERPSTRYERYDVRGLIPAGWFPSAVLVHPKSNKLYVVSAKGVSTTQNARPRRYIASLHRGIVSVVDMPDDDQLQKYTAQVVAQNGFDEGASVRVAKPNTRPSAIPRRVGDPSPIKHVLYIIKENRTYDQVFGDLPRGNGDPRLVLFGREVTPNQHALAEEYVLLDNFYVDGSVSADGHPWSNGAIASDAIDKTWSYSYSMRGDMLWGPATWPTAGFLWDFVKQRGLTYRSYGEFCGVTSLDKEHCCPGYSVGLEPLRDQERASRFVEELHGFEANDRFPNFMVMSLPNNHTCGTQPGKPTPKAMVADNDLALGRIVEAVSHSKFWKETAIFVLEDDAQDGPDHVDAHRSPALVISPFTRRRIVDSTLYDTCAMLRTIELILGLPPMTQFDAAAAPMFTCFTNKPDFKPYKCLPNQHPLDELNKSTAYGARQSRAMNFDAVDAAPFGELNRILWHSIKGENTPMPVVKSHRRSTGLALAED